MTGEPAVFTKLGAAAVRLSRLNVVRRGLTEGGEANEANELNDCLRNLQMIKRKLQAGIKDSNCAVGFITLQDSESAMNYLTMIVNNPGGSYRILGRDKLAVSEFSMR